MRDKQSLKESADTEIVELQVWVDIVAAVEALRFKAASTIYLVISTDNCAFKNSFNLRLLQQTSQILNKKVVLVSSDPVVGDLCKKVGLAWESEIDEKVMAAPGGVEDEEESPVDESSQPAEEDQVKQEADDALKTRLEKVVGAKSSGGQATVVTSSSETATDLDIKKPIIEVTAPEESAPQESTDSKIKPPHKPKNTPPPLFATSTSDKNRSGISWKVLLVAVALLVAVGLVAFFWPKKAVITIETEVFTIRLADFQVHLYQNQNGVDVKGKSLPLKMFDLDRRLETELPTSGQTEGSRAKGFIEIYNCHTTRPLTINSSTIFQKDNLDFRLDARNLEFAIDPASGDNCQATTAFNNKLSVRIEAVEVGDSYNVGEGSYQIVGVDKDDYNVIGGALEGGQSPEACLEEEALQEVTQTLQAMRQDEQAKRDLKTKIETEHGDYIALPQTFQQAVGEPTLPATCPQAADNKADQLMVYYMGGIRREDLMQVIRPSLEKQAEGLSIIEDGLSTADFVTYQEYEVAVGRQPTIHEPAPWVYYVIVNITDATASNSFDSQKVAKDSAGQQVKSVAVNLRRFRGVRNAHVALKPLWVFWVSDMPGDSRDIEVKIETIERQSGS